MGKPSLQGGKKGATSAGKGDRQKDQKTKGASSSAKSTPTATQSSPDVVFTVFDAKDNLDLSCKDGSKIDSKDALLDVLRADCVRAFTAKGLSEGEDNYSTGATFFISAEKVPENGLESLALQIFRKHTEGKRFDARRSGAEWWTQVIDAEDDIGAHWDRDYDLEEEEGVHMYPSFGTVSYFTAVGAPTLVVDAVGTASADDDVQGEFSRRNEKRITFLVNIWLDHVPSQGTPLPDDIAAALQCPVLTPAQLELLSPAEAALPVRRVDVGATERVKMLPFMHSEFLFDAAIPLPDDLSALEAAAQDKAIVELRYTGEMKPLIMLNEEEEEEEKKPLPPAKKQRRG
eukprot:gene10424-7411_t